MGSSRADGSVPAPLVSPQERGGSCISKTGETCPGSWGGGRPGPGGPPGQRPGTLLTGAAVYPGSQQGPVSVGPVMRPPSLWDPKHTAPSSPGAGWINPPKQVLGWTQAKLALLTQTHQLTDPDSAERRGTSGRATPWS